tara:strand:+ start:982 stop:1632 length:651 start_codon:yes stop_codon:yes gene_type:complete
VNILCVKVGNKYDFEYVNRLYYNTRQYFPQSKFHCITENSEGISPEVSIIPLPPDNLEKWWWKMWLFNPEWMRLDDCLYLDLDLVLQDKFEVLYDKYPTILYNYWNSPDWLETQKHKRYSYCDLNTSVISWNRNTDRKSIWHDFNRDREIILFIFRGIDNWICSQKKKVNFYPEIAGSYNEGGWTNHPVVLFNWNGQTGQDTKPHEIGWKSTTKVK